MARIPDAELERLKREVSLERLVRARGIELKRHGQNLIGLCPFHDDKEPSLVITPSKNLWHCLGACRKGGTVVDWVMKVHGVEFRHAVELLRADAQALTEPTPLHPSERTKRRQLPPLVERDANDQELLHRVVDYYHETLKQSPEALAYLEQRGLKNSEAFEHFRLGFANRTLGYRLPSKSSQEGEEVRGRLQSLGLLRPSGHEHFNGSLVMPVIDEDGHVTEIYGRKVGASFRAGTPRHLYLPGPHEGIWNVAAVQAYDELILCESLIDALTFWCAGYRNVTSSYGIEGFTPAHMAAFERHGTKRVLIAYDRDDAGERAAGELAEKLMAKGIDCYRVQFPRGMDANEYALKVQPASKSLGLLIRKAVWLGKGKAPAVELGASSVTEATTPAPSRPAAKEGDKADPPAPEIPKAKPSSDTVAVAAVTPATAEPSHTGAVAQVEAEPAATPEPKATPLDISTEVRDDQVFIHLGSRRYRIRGLPDEPDNEQLKVNLHVTHVDPKTGEPDLDRGDFVDRVDLYAFARRASFAKQAALELGTNERVLQRDLGKILHKLEELQHERQQREREPKNTAVELSDEDKTEAMALLEDPKLLGRILEDFERCGVVGEQTNKLVGYLAAVSRKLEEPLGVLIQSTSAAGKSSLMEAVLAMVPEEERIQYSAMTGQSLYYMTDTKLKHKVLAIAEEEGAERASYALKLLQSEGQLTIASTGKDPETGRLVTEDRHVEGPVMLLLTTTAIEIDEELTNRCIVLTVNEERQQTQAIHRLQRQRQTLEGLLARRSADQVRRLHRNAQRLLRPLLVANPYAEQLTFQDDRTRMRRDHMKYLTLIRTVALLHQYQREVKQVEHDGKPVEYIEVTPEDIAIANRLAHEVLGRSLDELAPQTRRLLMQLEAMVREACEREQLERADNRFTRREVRDHSGWGNTQLKIHLARLVDHEYLVVHRGGRGQSFAYELVYDGEGRDGSTFLTCLLDVTKLAEGDYDRDQSGQTGGWSGQSDGWSGSGRPAVGPGSAPGRGPKQTEIPFSESANSPSPAKPPKNAYREEAAPAVS